LEDAEGKATIVVGDNCKDGGSRFRKNARQQLHECCSSSSSGADNFTLLALGTSVFEPMAEVEGDVITYIIGILLMKTITYQRNMERGLDG
jgi:hypothetical protein